MYHSRDAFCEWGRSIFASGQRSRNVLCRPRQWNHEHSDLLLLMGRRAWGTGQGILPPLILVWAPLGCTPPSGTRPRPQATYIVSQRQLSKSHPDSYNYTSCLSFVFLVLITFEISKSNICSRQKTWENRKAQRKKKKTKSLASPPLTDNHCWPITQGSPV